MSQTSSVSESGSSDLSALSHCKVCSNTAPDLGSSCLSLDGALKDSVVFITGGTGFVGSVLLEQILRLYPDVKRVYLLIRSKRGQSAEERLQALFRSKKLFASLLVDGRLPPALQAKVAAVAGDTTLPGLGLAPEDRALLAREVNWIVHSAASISFFEHIHTLLSQNYEATREVAALAAACTGLRGFVHVSTAYVNSNLPRSSHIEEKIYPLVRKGGEPLQHKALAAHLTALPPAQAEREAQALLKEFRLPNSYCLTKHMCEDLLADLHSPAFPVAIVRPSIIGSLAAAPLPGYFGNTAGFTSVALAFATGMARYTCHWPFSVYDVIPCDVVGYVCLAALPALQTAHIQKNPVLVLHPCSSVSNPLVLTEALQRGVIPYWVHVPPRHRLSNKPYKTDFREKNAWVDYGSLTFKMLTMKTNWRMKRTELLLRAIGKTKVADLLQSSYKIWKLYNTPTMDFELFFCCQNVMALERLLGPKQVAAKQLKLVWTTEDSWVPYLLTHQVAIRAKYYPDTVDQAKGYAYDPPLLDFDWQHAELQTALSQAIDSEGRRNFMRWVRQPSTVLVGPSTDSSVSLAESRKGAAAAPKEGLYLHELAGSVTAAPQLITVRA